MSSCQKNYKICKETGKNATHTEKKIANRKCPKPKSLSTIF